MFESSADESDSQRAAVVGSASLSLFALQALEPMTQEMINIGKQFKDNKNSGFTGRLFKSSDGMDQWDDWKKQKKDIKETNGWKWKSNREVAHHLLVSKVGRRAASAGTVKLSFVSLTLSRVDSLRPASPVQKRVMFSGASRTLKRSVMLAWCRGSRRWSLHCSSLSACHSLLRTWLSLQSYFFRPSVLLLLDLLLLLPSLIRSLQSQTPLLPEYKLIRIPSVSCPPLLPQLTSRMCWITQRLSMHLLSNRYLWSHRILRSLQLLNWSRFTPAHRRCNSSRSETSLELWYCSDAQSGTRALLVVDSRILPGVLCEGRCRDYAGHVSSCARPLFRSST